MPGGGQQPLPDEATWSGAWPTAINPGPRGEPLWGSPEPFCHGRSALSRARVLGHQIALSARAPAIRLLARCVRAMMGFMDEVGDLQSANGRRRPAGTVAATLGVFLVVFYLWGALIVATEDQPPTGESCVVPRSYIVMDEQDLLTGAESVRWFPVPVAVCTGADFTREQWSIYHALGFPFALVVAGAVGWAVWGAKNPRREELTRPGG